MNLQLLQICYFFSRTKTGGNLGNHLGMVEGGLQMGQIIVAGGMQSPMKQMPGRPETPNLVIGKATVMTPLLGDGKTPMKASHGMTSNGLAMNMTSRNGTNSGRPWAGKRTVAFVFKLF